jgi:hypothetical protein
MQRLLYIASFLVLLREFWPPSYGVELKSAGMESPMLHKMSISILRHKVGAPTPPSNPPPFLVHFPFLLADNWYTISWRLLSLGCTAGLRSDYEIR